MPRRETAFLPQHFYHVYNRGNNRQKIFLEAENYRFFLKRLHFYFDPQGISLIAYCLMPNHYHMVLCFGRTTDFSNVMRSFSVSYIKSFNKLYRRVGHLFQGNFEAREVDSDEYLAHLIRYIHFNPVRSSMVTEAEDWENSDYSNWVSNSGKMGEASERVRSRLFGNAEGYKTFCDNLRGEMEMRAGLEKLLFR